MVMYAKKNSALSSSERNETFLKYIPLLKFIAGRIAMRLPPHIDINDITIKMVSSFSKPTTIGYCYPAKGEIHLLESFWNYASHIEKEALIYHELGHCFLNRSHQSGKVNGLAISYMYPDNDYINFYDAYKDAYVEELFTGNSSKIKKILASERNTSAALNTNNQGIVYTCGNDHI